MQKQDSRAAFFMIAANVLLIAVKLSVVVLTGSIAAIAVLADSSFDLFGSFLAFVGMKKAEQPADHNHLYGHAKFEALSSAAQLALISITASAIILEGMHRLANPDPLKVTQIDLALIAFTIIVDIVIVAVLRRASDTRLSLKASLGNYQSDILQNALVLAGLYASGQGFLLADPLAAILVAVFMFRVVFTVGKETVEELTDGGPDARTLKAYGKTILSVKGVRSFHKLRARFVGGRVHIDVHVQMSPAMTLRKSHALAGAVKYAVLETHSDVAEVLVHAEPAEKESSR